MYDSEARRRDLEFGPVFISAPLKRVLTFYKTKWRFVRAIGFAFIALSLSLLVRYAFDNADKISDTVITFEESPYKIFVISDNVITNPLTVQENYPIKSTVVNRRLQTFNLQTVEHKIREYLVETNNLCIHARHFASPYDILVFKNVTMINAELEALSSVFKNVNEMSISGEARYARRSLSVTVGYFDINLQRQTRVVLHGNMALCFQHYILVVENK
jgi:hypothetical protein